MRVAALILCSLAIAGLWIWAATTRVKLTPLPERMCGTFQLFRFEPPDGVSMANPLATAQTRWYTFRPDGTYRLSILVSGGYEMLRSEGRAVLDEKQVLTLHRISLNRREDPGEPERFGTYWGKDEQGKYLVLRHVVKGHWLYLRRVKEEPAEPPAKDQPQK
jgi:hypothetical protein